MPENIPPAAYEAATEAITEELKAGREVADEELAYAAVTAAAPIFAEACAQAILAHMELHGPKPNGAGRRAWRRQFGIAARVAAGCFTTRDEQHAEAAEALTAALASGQAIGCNPEAAMIAAAERDGTMVRAPRGKGA